MVNISVKKNYDFYEKITISGHALYDDFGKDIVCSAISSIVITTVNAILTLDKDAISYENTSDLVIKIIKKDETTNKLIQNMINLLEELERDYPKNIKFI